LEKDIEAANVLYDHLAERSTSIPEDHVAVILGNPLDYYPEYALKAVKRLNPERILIVGKGGEEIPEWKRIRDGLFSMEPRLEDKTLIHVADDSMHTGMNITTAIKILMVNGLKPKDLVLIQMPTGLRISRRIFEFQWQQIADELGYSGRPPTFHPYAINKPFSLSLGQPASERAQFFLEHMVGQIDRLQNWPDAEPNPIIARHPEDLPQNVLDAASTLRDFLARSELRKPLTILAWRDENETVLIISI